MPKRITIFAGHYGSGKTQLAVNYALMLLEDGKRTALADLDVVNPYFRSSDAAGPLGDVGIRVIASPYAGSNIDAPSVPADAHSVFDDKETFSVIDVGGDDRGALALGRYADDIRAEIGGTDIFLVINRFRVQTRGEASAVEMKREIEAAAGIRFTGVVNNSNLGWQTTARDVVESETSYAVPVSEMLGLPLVMTGVRADLFDQVSGWVTNPFEISIFDKRQWRIYNEEQRGE